MLGPRAVDIAEAQDDGFDPEGSRIGGTVSLASQLAGAVCGNRMRWQFFMDWWFAFADGRSTRSVDESSHTVVPRGFQAI